MQPFEKVERGKKQIILNNFLGGVAWGLGSTVGLAIVLTVAGLIISKINVPKIISGFITSIVEQTAKDNPQLFKQ